MNWTRLSTVDPKLSELLQAAPEEKCRTVARAVVDFALDSAPTTDNRIDAAREALVGGLCGDSDARRQLNELTQELDELAWGMQREVDRGRRPYEEYLVCFNRARAVAALWFALEPAASVAAVEAVYEAQAAAGDIRPVAEVVGRIL